MGKEISGTKLRGATVGTFDGLHPGHKLVLRTLKKEAYEEQFDPIAITFDRHPLDLIAPERSPGFLIPTDRKKELLEAEGVTPVVIPFNEKLRRQTAYEWMRRLHDDFGVRLLVVGYDNTFGSDGVSLNIGDYEALGEVIGIRVIEAPALNGISSSAIRKAVRSGEVEEATRLMGRPFRIEGIVKAGNHLGAGIGFPTANLPLPSGQVLPAEGVYSALATLADGSLHPAAVNIGRRPTIGDLDSPIVEAHILDYKGDIYGEKLTLDLISKIRGEVKFNSLEALAERLRQDVREARKRIDDYLTAHSRKKA